MNTCDPRGTAQDHINLPEKKNGTKKSTMGIEHRPSQNRNSPLTGS